MSREATYDPFTLQPVTLTDLHGSVTTTAFDPLGRVTATALLGRPSETKGDLDHPTQQFTYAFAAYDEGTDTWTPAHAHSQTRREHWAGASPDTPTYDEAWIYVDGEGRDLLTKVRAAPHPDTPSTPRFVSTGRVLLDAKGNPVKQYEPYFTDTSDWEPDATAAMQGVTPILHYDPLGRLVRTDHPDGTHERIDRTPWQERHFDRTDTLPDIDGYTETDLHDILNDFETPTGPLSNLDTGHPWLDARAAAAHYE